MAARPRNAAVPAALRPQGVTSAPAPQPVPQVPHPRPGPDTTDAAGPDPVAPPDALTVHVAILIDHPKIYEAIKDRISVVGPQYQPIELHAHVILDDHRHKAHAIHPRVRMAMAELGLVDPVEVGFTDPYQVSLGWPKPKETP